MKTKLVGFAYPTSPLAKQFGFNATGCHTVDLWSVSPLGVLKQEHIAGYADKSDAIKHAESLPFAWNKMYLRFSA